VAYDEAMRLPSASPLLIRRAALVLFAAGAAACGGEAAGSPRGIVLISIDSLRADHMSCYGYESATAPGVATSPIIDARLAAEGVLFEEAISTTSWTVPAHMAMLAGQPDRMHGVLEPTSRLPQGRRLLAEAFQDAGWRTGGFYSGPNLDPWFGFGRGFERYVDCTSVGVDPDKFGATDAAGRKELRAMEEASHKGHTGPAVAAAFETWLDDVAVADDAPFFGFVHLWDVHYDFEPPAEFDLFSPNYTGDQRGVDVPSMVLSELDPDDAARVTALYDGEIRFTDHTIGRMLDALEARGLLDDTLIVLTSDHGEELGEHGRYGHNKTLYDEVVHVPLILRWPGRVPAGVRVAEQVSLVGIAPTLLELADLPAESTHVGRSFAGAFDDAYDFAEEPAPLELAFGRPDPARKRAAMEGLRTRTDKVVRNFPGERPVVYDLVQDPGEHAPKVLEPTDVRLIRAKRAWDAIVEQARLLPRETGTLPDELQADLEAAGYLGGTSSDE